MNDRMLNDEDMHGDIVEPTFESVLESDEFTHDEFSEKLPIPKKEMWKEHKAIVIDRKQEDADVLEFQRTGDMRLLEKIYNNRIPTLKVWATKHYYHGVTMSQDDLFEELSIVFVKAAQKFQKVRGSFNTCLFTFLQHRIINIKSAMHAKKRVSEYYEGPRAGMILSLDYPCGENESSGATLKDILPDPNYNPKKMNIDDTVDVLAEGSEVVKDFLYKVSNGESISTILTEAKQEEGTLTLPNDSVKKIKGGGKKAIKDFLKENQEFGQEFDLVEYDLVGVDLTYKVQFKKTEKYEIISRAIRNFKKNKNQYISKIK